MVFVYINIYFAARSGLTGVNTQQLPELIISVSEPEPDVTSNLKTVC